MLYAVSIALVAFLLRFLSLSGAAAAAIVGAVIWEAGGLTMAIPLVAFFVSSSALGKLPGGNAGETPRSAGQVAANGAAATLAAALWLFGVDEAPTMFLAALCAANADTWATEIGIRYGKKTVRISTLKPARPGVSGAVSIAGLIAAAAGATFIAFTGVFLDSANLALAALLGFFACLFDSILGDTVQAKFYATTGNNETGGTLVSGVRWIRNNEVNLAMTSAAAAAAYLLSG